MDLAPVVAAVVLLSMTFNDAAPEGLEHIKQGGVENSAYVQSKPGEYNLLRTDWFDLKPGTTYRVTMMVKSPTGARPLILSQVWSKRPSAFLWQKIMLQDPLRKDGPWQEVTATFTVTAEGLKAAGDQMVKAFEKAREKNPDAKAHPMVKAWMNKPDLTKPLRFRVLLFNWSASPAAKKRKMSVEGTVLAVDNLTIEEVPGAGR